MSLSMWAGGGGGGGGGGVVGLAKGDKNSPFPPCSCATSAAWFLLLCALCAHLICFLHAPLYAASELHTTTILPTGERGGGGRKPQ